MNRLKQEEVLQNMSEQKKVRRAEMIKI